MEQSNKRIVKNTLYLYIRMLVDAIEFLLNTHCIEYIGSI